MEVKHKDKGNAFAFETLGQWKFFGKSNKEFYSRLNETSLLLLTNLPFRKLVTAINQVGEMGILPTARISPCECGM